MIDYQTRENRLAKSKPNKDATLGQALLIFIGALVVAMLVMKVMASQFI